MKSKNCLYFVHVQYLSRVCPMVGSRNCPMFVQFLSIDWACSGHGLGLLWAWTGPALGMDWATGGPCAGYGWAMGRPWVGYGWVTGFRKIIKKLSTVCQSPSNELWATTNEIQTLSKVCTSLNLSRVCPMVHEWTGVRLMQSEICPDFVHVKCLS